jgi:hypothetical protein
MPVFIAAPAGGEMPNSITRVFFFKTNYIRRNKKRYIHHESQMIYIAPFYVHPHPGVRGFGVRCTPGVTGAMPFYPHSGVLLRI